MGWKTGVKKGGRLTVSHGGCRHDGGGEDCGELHLEEVESGLWSIGECDESDEMMF